MTHKTSRDPLGDFSLRIVSRIGKARGFEPRRSGQFLLPGLVEIEVSEASFCLLSVYLDWKLQITHWTL